MYADVDRVFEAWERGDTTLLTAFQTAKASGLAMRTAGSHYFKEHTKAKSFLQTLSVAIPKKSGRWCQDCAKYLSRPRLATWQVFGLDLSGFGISCDRCLGQVLDRAASETQAVVDALAEKIAADAVAKADEKDFYNLLNGTRTP